MMRDMQPTRPNVKLSGKGAWVPDYKDVATLQKLCSPQGKLFDRKTLGASAKMQRRITSAVKRARFLALLKYAGSQ